MRTTANRAAAAILFAALALPALEPALARESSRGRDREYKDRREQGRAKSRGQVRSDARDPDRSRYSSDRRPVVIHHGFPIHRSHWPSVVVRTPIVPIGAGPRTYLPPVHFSSTIYRPPLRDVSWQDSDTIWRGDNWVETALNADAWGRRLYLSVGGQAQLAFAEVVFENGEARVVDFRDRRVRSGRYLLLDIGGEGRVDYVRVVARSVSDRSTLTLFLER
jgi:hypothetical protein